MMQAPYPPNGSVPSLPTPAQSGSLPPSAIMSNGSNGPGPLSLLSGQDGSLPLLPGSASSLMQSRRVVVKPIAPKQQGPPPPMGTLGGTQRPMGQQPVLIQAMPLRLPNATVPIHSQPAPVMGVQTQPLTPHQSEGRVPSLSSQQALLASQLQSLTQQQAQALLSAISAKSYGPLGCSGGLEALADECLSQQQQHHHMLPSGAIGNLIKAVAAPPPQRPVTPMSLSQVTAMDTSDTSMAEDIPASVSQSRRPGVTTSKPRKPCNCRNSQCLKLYCDCFANGEFCGEGCHCCNCKNNVEHTEDRAKAVKTCLERNPNAFKPKVEQSRGNSGDERKHVKGCNCKRSGCLKNYCECYEAKIPCSNLCRCVGCKNLIDKPENKSLMQLADAADIRTQQQKAASSHIHEQLESTTISKPLTVTENGQRLPFSFINKDVAKATCLCLLEEASHALMNYKSPEEAERAVIEEFGKCIQQIIAAAGTASEVYDNSSAIL